MSFNAVNWLSDQTMRSMTGMKLCSVIMTSLLLGTTSSQGFAAEQPGHNDEVVTLVDLPREPLAEDRGGAQSWLQGHGITIKPRLVQFYQGIAAGDGKHGFEYGGKADVRMDFDLAQLGFWDGFSMTVQSDFNFGNTINGRAGVLIPPNTALNTPGIDGADAFDVSSFYFGQTFGESAAVLFGKLNMIEVVANKPFMGGAGIDRFWNQTFVATPTGTVPPYLLGALGAVFTEQATYRLWVFDPNSYANVTAFGNAFADGVSFRGSIDFNVTMAGRRGHQGLVAFYSTKDGTDLSSLGDILLPTPDPELVDTRNSRWYFGYSFDQTLRGSMDDPDDSFGLFGNVGVSDGNPNGLRWSMYLGVGGKGLLQARPRDAWGVGYFYDGISDYVKDVFAITDEQGLELFYEFNLTARFSFGVDLQVINPGLGSDTAIIPGLRVVVRL